MTEPKLRRELIRATLEDHAPITLIQKRIEETKNREAEGDSASASGKSASVSLHNDTSKNENEERSIKETKSKGSLLERALRPASALLRGALREIQEEQLPASQCVTMQDEIAVLKNHLQELEAALASM